MDEDLELRFWWEDAGPGMETVDVRARELVARGLDPTRLRRAMLHRPPDPRRPTSALSHALEEGVLRVVRRVPVFRPPVPPEGHPPPPLDPFEDLPFPQEEALRWFEVVVVDEVGEPVAGAALRVDLAGLERVETTDGDGRVRIENVTAGSAHVAFASYAALEPLLTPRWEREREGAPPSFPAVARVPFFEPLDTVAVAPFRPHLVVLTPPAFVEISLVDTLGRPVPDEPWELIAPDGQVHRGTLDADGHARIDGLPPGTCDVCFTRLHETDWQPLDALVMQ